MVGSRRAFGRLAALAMVSLVSVFSVAMTPAADWLHWRGPAETGEAADTDLPDRFSTDPTAPNSNLLWKAPVGCRSTPVIMNGRVFIINSDGEGINEGERVMAFDLNTGKVLWEHKFNVFHSDIVSSRVGWANPAGDAETGYVYAHGVQGLLFCFDGKSGKVVWQRSLTEEFGRVTGYGGRIVSPTVAGDLVIIGMINGSWGDQGRGLNRFVAFDKRTGTIRWWSSPCELMKGTYYSNPVIKTINGQRLLITGASDGHILALKVNTGERVWSYQIGGNVINTSVVVDGNLVYGSHGEENVDVAKQGRVVCLDAGEVKDGKPKLVWEKIGVKAGLASLLIHDGRLYVPDDGATLYCYDAKKGTQLWKYKYGRVARGAPVFADGKIYLAEVNAKFHILKPGDKECKEISTTPFFSRDGSLVETNGTPAVADGKIIFGTRDELYCVGKKDRKAASAARPAKPEEQRVAPSTPVFALLDPADVVLKPGESVTFVVRSYDQHGQLVGEAKSAQWSLPLPPKTPAGLQPPALQGEVKDGKLTVAKMPPGQQGYVDVKVGNLTARARVRVAPQLPYKLDLSKVPVGATPGGWVNCQGKYVVVEKDGKKLLKKLANSSVPPLARANAYIIMPDASHYVIQADVMGTYVNQNLPDHGIVNSRYTLQLNGNKQQLRLLSWEALPRIDKTIEFPWKANEWYSLKLAIEYRDKVAIVRGKAWPRGQAEPTKWTIEVEDPRPNREGSAALYAYATGVLPTAPGAESFFENVSVVPSK